jgi:hypothetical protein
MKLQFSPVPKQDMASHTLRSSSRRGTTRILLLKPMHLFKDDKSRNSDETPTKDTTSTNNNKSWLNAASEKQRQFMEVMEERRTVVVESLLQMLPPQVSAFLKLALQKILDFLPTFRTISLSFLAGAVISICVVIAPVFTMADKFAEPVTLFETILTDLDRG